jgi:hypothetical protein
VDDGVDKKFAEYNNALIRMAVQINSTNELECKNNVCSLGYFFQIIF